MSLDIITALHIALSRSLQCPRLVSVSPGPVSDMQRPAETCRELRAGDWRHAERSRGACRVITGAQHGVSLTALAADMALTLTMGR